MKYKPNIDILILTSDRYMYNNASRRYCASLTLRMMENKRFELFA